MSFPIKKNLSLDNIIADSDIHPSWYDFFTKNTDKLEIVISYLQSITYFPDPDFMFSSFSMPLKNINVVIANDRQVRKFTSCNIPFAYKGTVPMFDKREVLSRIIRDAIYRTENRIDIDDVFDRSLKHWINQGVFLINVALTTGIKYDHLKLWQPFMSGLFGYLRENTNQTVFTFLGENSNYYKRFIYDTKEKKGHIKLEYPNPYYDVKEVNTKPFTNSGIFTTINSILEHNYGKQKINWIE